MAKHISEVLEKLVVIAKGTTFTIGDEAAPRFPRGHGGNAFLFKLNDTGKVVYSTNVWNSGEAEDPDTATIIEYKDWQTYGVSEYGQLTEHADVYVNNSNL